MSDWETVGEKPYTPYVEEPEPAKGPLDVFITLDSIPGSFIPSPALQKALSDMIRLPAISMGKSHVMMNLLKGRGELKTGFAQMSPTAGYGGYLIIDELVDQEIEPENWAHKRGLGKPKVKKPNSPRGNELYGTGWRKRK